MTTPSPTRQEPLALPVGYSAYRASLKDANGNLIGLLHDVKGYAIDPEHAKAIVTACNAFPALLAACEAVLLDYDDGTLTVSRREQLRAALALAGKGEERG